MSNSNNVRIQILMKVELMKDTIYSIINILCSTVLTQVTICLNV